MENDSEKFCEIYKKNKNDILNVAKEQFSITKELGLDEAQSEGANICDIINGIIKKLQTDTLRVFVIGRFNSGKSTFINALLGQAILPTSPTPATAVLCIVKYVDDKGKRAILFPKPGMGKNGDDSSFEIKISNIEEISKVQDELKKYVMIDHFGTSDETSRYEKLELYYDLPLCKNDVELIDSVGLDDPEYRDKIVMEYMPSVDVIIYCMDSQSAYSRSDKAVFNLIKSLKHDSIFFVMTKIDQLKDSFDGGEISEFNFKNIICKELTPWTELGKQGIMFIDSRSALKGKLNNDAKMLESSGISELEKSLEGFLIREKGRAKLLNTLLSLRNVNRSIRKTIPARISMLQLSAKELEKRYKEAEAPLKTLEMKRQVIIQKFDTKKTDISREAYDMAMVYCAELPNKIRQWASEYEIESSIGLIPTKSNIEPVVEEVIDYLKGKVDEDTIEWTANNLNPMVESSVEELKASLETQARDFVKSVEVVRVQISVGEEVEPPELTKDVSTVERLIGIGYICVTGDFITGGLGAALGMKAMLTTIACEIAGGFLLALLGFLNPVTFIGALVVSIIAGNFVGRSSIKTGIKKKVGNKIAEDIESNSMKICKNVENKVKDAIGEIEKALDAGLASEISGIRNEVKKILEDKAKGDLNTNNEIKRLEELEVINANIEEKLDKLMHEAGIMDKAILEVPIQVRNT